MTVRPDQPRRVTSPERVAFSNGMLLDQADFATEQAYHRGRLALFARYLIGFGTVAGLEVSVTPGPPVQVRINPGLALDRIGRMVESPTPLCLDLDRWLADRTLGEVRLRPGSGGGPDTILADVFIGFRECEVAQRPAVAGAAFDALGAVVPLRLRDAVEATLVLRAEDVPPLPDRGPVAPPGATPAARRLALDTAKRQASWVEEVWWDGIDGPLTPDREHRDGQNPADLFLARLTLPMRAGPPPTRDPDLTATADNAGRRMAYSAAEVLSLGL